MQQHTHTGAHIYTQAHATAVRELLTSSFCSSLAPALCALLFVLLSAMAALLPPSGLLPAPTVTPTTARLHSHAVCSLSLSAFNLQICFVSFRFRFSCCNLKNVQLEVIKRCLLSGGARKSFAVCCGCCLG